MITKKDLVPKNKPFGNSKTIAQTTAPKNPLKRNGPAFMKAIKRAMGGNTQMSNS